MNDKITRELVINLAIVLLAVVAGNLLANWLLDLLAIGEGPADG